MSSCSWKIITTVIIFITIIFSPRVLAQSRIESENYQIQFPSLNSGAGIPTSETYRLDTTVGQGIAGPFSSTGYVVKAGFQYIHSIIPFTFTISDASIVFGTLNIGEPVTQKNTLKVTSGGAGGYFVKASENHPLQNKETQVVIEDTTCDTQKCNEVTAGPWLKKTTFGFGFNISGDDIPDDLIDENYFRQFTDTSLEEEPQIIMSKSRSTRNYPQNSWPWASEAVVTYKLNPPPAQIAGEYSNVVTFTAIPSF